MGSDLRAEAEDEAAAGVRLQIPADVGHGHGVSRERHGDAGTDLQARGVLGGEREGKERIVVDLPGPTAVVTVAFRGGGRLGHTIESAGDAPVHLEAGHHAVTHGR